MFEDIANFFKKVKTGAESLSIHNFPEIISLEKIIRCSLKYNQKQSVEACVKSCVFMVKPLFFPECLFDRGSLDIIDVINGMENQNEKEEKKLHRKAVKIRNRYEYILALPCTTESKKKDVVNLLSDNIKENNSLDERQKLVNSSSLQFKLIPLDEIRENEKNDYTGENIKYYNILYKNKRLREEYLDYWNELLACMEQYFHIDEWHMKTNFMPHIQASRIWTRSRLLELYAVLVEKKYIEPQKGYAFASIFSGFYYDYSDMLPIKWLCPCQRTGSDTNSNLTMLYYLVVALMDWQTFISIKEERDDAQTKECILSFNKNLLAEYFIHGNGEKIDNNSLLRRNNKYVLQCIEHIILPFIEKYN